MDMKRDLPFLQSLAQALAVQFGKNCEVVVHDLTVGDAEHTIAAIENGHVTSRKIGGTASHVVLEALKSSAAEPLLDRHGYHTRTAGGRTLKSSTVYIPDEKGKPVGIFSINVDVTDMVRLQHELNEFTGFAQEKESVETISSTVESVLESLIQEAISFVGKPADLMDKDEKITAIQFLEKRGAFLIKFAGDKITKLFGISKYTLYNYLKTDNDETKEL